MKERGRRSSGMLDDQVEMETDGDVGARCFLPPAPTEVDAIPVDTASAYLIRKPKTCSDFGLEPLLPRETRPIQAHRFHVNRRSRPNTGRPPEHDAGDQRLASIPDVWSSPPISRTSGRVVSTTTRRCIDGMVVNISATMIARTVRSSYGDEWLHQSIIQAMPNVRLYSMGGHPLERSRNPSTHHHAESTRLYPQPQPFLLPTAASRKNYSLMSAIMTAFLILSQAAPN